MGPHQRMQRMQQAQQQQMQQMQQQHHQQRPQQMQQQHQAQQAQQHQQMQQHHQMQQAPQMHQMQQHPQMHQMQQANAEMLSPGGPQHNNIQYSTQAYTPQQQQPTAMRSAATAPQPPKAAQMTFCPYDPKAQGYHHQRN